MLPVDIQITYQVINCAHCTKMLAGGKRIVINDEGKVFCDMICEESWRHRYSILADEFHNRHSWVDGAPRH